MKKNIYKEYLKKEKLKEIKNKKIVVKEEKNFINILSFLFECILKIIRLLFYLLIIILTSIGATYLINKLGIFNLGG